MFTYPSSSGQLLVVEDWEFRDAENVNFTLDRKQSGCMCKNMQARKSSSVGLGSSPDERFA